MTKNTFNTILVCYWLVILSIVYFISLLFAAPVGVVLLLIAAAAMMFWKYKPAHAELTHALSRSESRWSAWILIIGLAFILHTAYDVVEKNGHWDAWWFWNVRANYLARPEYWKGAFSGKQFGTMFTVPVAHSDYPPFLPLLNGLCWRIMQMQPTVVPFALSMFSLALIASVLFLELYPRNKVVAVAALFFLTTQDYIVKIGTGQVADNWIGLFLLLAYISYHSWELNRSNQDIICAGVMLGSALWTKNEGIILALMFLLFTISDLIRRKCLSKLFLGMAVPLTALILFKGYIAPSNDIIAAQNDLTWNKITDMSRYAEVRRLAWDMIQLYFPSIPYLVIGYFLFCLIEKRRPDREIWMIILSFLSYLSIYIVTPHNIGWHINTSVDRLIFQLTPTLIWIIAVRLSIVEVKLPKRPANDPIPESTA